MSMDKGTQLNLLGEKLEATGETGSIGPIKVDVVKDEKGHEHQLLDLREMSRKDAIGTAALAIAMKMIQEDSPVAYESGMASIIEQCPPETHGDMVIELNQMVIYHLVQLARASVRMLGKEVRETVAGLN